MKILVTFVAETNQKIYAMTTKETLDRVRAIITKMDDACAKDDLKNLPREELEGIVSDAYESLQDLVRGLSASASCKYEIRPKGPKDSGLKALMENNFIVATSISDKFMAVKLAETTVEGDMESLIADIPAIKAIASDLLFGKNREDSPTFASVVDRTENVDIWVYNPLIGWEKTAAFKVDDLRKAQKDRK